MREKLRVLWSCIYPFIIYFAVEFFVQIVFSLRSRTGEAGGPGALILTAAVDAVAVPFLLAVFLGDQTEDETAEKDRSFRTSAAVLVSGVAGAAGLCTLVSILISATGIPESDAAFEKVDSLISEPGLPVQILCACVAAPAAEELLFRGILFRRIKDGFGPLIGITVSAVAFGCFHGNLTQGIYAGILGFFFAWAYWKTNAFLLPVLMHAGSNLANILLSETGPGQALGDSDAGVLLLLGAGAVLWIFSIFFIRRHRVRTENGKDGTDYEITEHRDSLL